MSKPWVSVILPTFNRAILLRRAISSVLQQTFGDFELIVVDDGSTEDIRSVVAAFQDSRLVYVRREMNGGVAAARNTGTGVARGEYLAFQDSDDEWLLDKIERQRSLVQGGADIALCGLLRVGDGTLRRYVPPRANSLSSISNRDIIGHPITYTQTWLVRTSKVVAAGGFDERLKIWDDWELLIRLANDADIRTDSTPFVVSQQQEDSLSTKRSAFIHDMALILQKHESLLSSHPREHAKLHYVHARLLAADRRLGEAREALYRSLAIRPRSARPWALGAATLLGPGFVQALLQRQSRVRGA